MFVQRYELPVSFWPLWPPGVFYPIHHAVMGVAIGASGMRIHWALHGILWGLLFGLFLVTGYWEQPLTLVLLLGTMILKGFLIELVTTACLGIKGGGHRYW